MVSNSALHHQILQVPQPSISAEEVTIKVPVGNANQKMVEDGPLKDKTLFGDFEVFVQEGVGRRSQSTSMGSEGNNVVIMQGRVGDWKRKARAMASPNMSDNFAGVGGKRPNDNMLIGEKNKCPRLTGTGVDADSVHTSTYSAKTIRSPGCTQNSLSVMGTSGLVPSREMNALCWNCQGMGNPWTVQGLKGLVSLNIPSFISLSETRCTVAEMTRVRCQIGWRNIFVVPCKFVPKKGGKGVSRAGGVALLWKEDVVVVLNSYSDYHIDVLVGEANDPKRWRFTGIYGQPKVADRHLTWNLLKLLLTKSSLPWLLGGDFNEILSSREKEGGITRSQQQMSGFCDAVDSCSPNDLAPVGPAFTWRGIRSGEEIKVRLDRFLANDG